MNAILSPHILNIHSEYVKPSVNHSNLDMNNHFDKMEYESIYGRDIPPQQVLQPKPGDAEFIGALPVETAGKDVIFGSDTKSSTKLNNQMEERGWTQDAVMNTVDNPYTTRVSINKATGKSATVYYTKQGSYVVVDDTSKVIIQVSDNINPSTWAPDTSIVNPYIPK